MKPAQVPLREHVTVRLDARDLCARLQGLSNCSHPVPLGRCWGDTWRRGLRRSNHHRMSRRTVRHGPADQTDYRADYAAKRTARYRAVEACHQESKQSRHPDRLTMPTGQRAEHPDQTKRTPPAAAPMRTPKKAPFSTCFMRSPPLRRPHHPCFGLEGADAGAQLQVVDLQRRVAAPRASPEALLQRWRQQLSDQRPPRSSASAYSATGHTSSYRSSQLSTSHRSTCPVNTTSQRSR